MAPWWWELKGTVVLIPLVPSRNVPLKRIAAMVVPLLDVAPSFGEGMLSQDHALSITGNYACKIFS